MRVMILVPGTRGHVQPFIALAQGIQSFGHHVSLWLPDAEAPLAERYGLSVVSFDDSPIRPTGKLKAGQSVNVHTPIVTVLGGAIRRSGHPMASLFDGMAKVVQKKDADIIVHEPVVPGHEIADALDIPAVPVCLLPILVPTAEFPNPRLPFAIPRWLNRTSYRWSKIRIRSEIGNIDRWRQDTLGLSGRRRHHDVLLRPDRQQATVLHPLSRHVFPPPSDYPPTAHTTGFWFLPTPPDWSPTIELAAFLDAGDPPVYIGFGSTIGRDPAHLGEVVVEAVRRAKVRAIVSRGWGGIQLNEKHDEIFFLDDAPFDWLFQRVSAVIHHGGIGTAADALLAGRPQAICPFNVAQDFVARWLHSTELAPPPLPPNTLSAASLADAIRNAQSNHQIVERTRRTADLIYAEEGVRNAVKILENVVEEYGT